MGMLFPAPKKQSEADIVVIGSGIGGLCCAALLARYGEDVLLLESHDQPGGAAHSFEIKGYKFDSGPSLFSGFQSRGPQANPLAQVLDALGESVPFAKYDSWMVYIPEADFLSRIGPTEFFKQVKTQQIHEMKKKEKEYIQLQERLNQVLNEKKKESKSGVEIMNLLQKEGRQRGTWNGKKADNDYHKKILDVYEAKNQELMQENNDLRALLRPMQDLILGSKEDMLSGRVLLAARLA